MVWVSKLKATFCVGVNVTIFNWCGVIEILYKNKRNKKRKQLFLNLGTKVLHFSEIVLKRLNEFCIISNSTALYIVLWLLSSGYLIFVCV